MSRFLVRAVAVAAVTTSVGLVAASTGSAFNYVSDSNGTFWGFQDVAQPRVDTGSIRATQVGAGQNPAYSTTINGFGGIKVWVSTTPAPRLDGELMRGFGLKYDGDAHFATTQAVDLGGVDIARDVPSRRRSRSARPTGRAGSTGSTNTTSAPITVKVAFGGQSGYGASGSNSSALVDTSDGDTQITADDSWAEVATPLSGSTLVGGPQATVIGTPSTAGSPFAGAMTFTGNWLYDTFNNPFSAAGHDGNFQAYVNTLTLAPGQTKSLAALRRARLARDVDDLRRRAHEGRDGRGRAGGRAGPERPLDGAGLLGRELQRRDARIPGFSAASCASAPPIPAIAVPPAQPHVTTSPYDVVDKTIDQMQADMESGKTTSQQITRAYLDRIAAYDQGQFGFNSYDYVATDAMAQAKAADDARAAGRTRPRHPDRDQEPLRHQGHGDDERQPHVRRLPPDEGRLPGRQAARGRRRDHRQGEPRGVRDQRQLLQQPVGPGLERVPAVEVGDRLQSGGSATAIAASFAAGGARLADGRLAVRPGVRGPSS